MPHDFYKSERYRRKQSILTRENWRKGVFNFFYQKEERGCKRIECGKTFQVVSSDPKVFCSQSCAATFNNKKRKQPLAVRLKIAEALKGRPNPRKGVLLVPRKETVCKRPSCGNVFVINEPWRKKQFCSKECAGRRPTSPKAAKAKNGIRPDVHPGINFYSRWEANFARILMLLKIRWEFQSKTFNLKKHRYTPDFYLPGSDVYIEIKNFLGEYSAERDKEFRELYPNERLVLILKKDYLKLQEKFAPLIKNWEYS